MKLLMAHCYYRERGGEDASFESESALLRANGHDVATYVRRNAEIEGVLAHARVPFEMAYSRRAFLDVRELIARERPALAHFQNTHPLMSPSVYDACRAARVPVVQSLRNYRLMCPNAIFFRDGRACEDCLGLRIAWPGVLHACYRGSRAQTAAVAASSALHAALGTWRRKVDLFIALTEFARRKFVEGGLPADRIVVKPNFVADPGPPRAVPEDGAVLYVGRLSPEKGVEDLLRAKGGWRLRIVGDGADRARLESLADASRTSFAGALSAAAVLEEMARASLVVVPSRWYETFGRVVVEAYACGRAVVASRIGALAELVPQDALFEPGNPESLAEAVARARPEAARRGEAARREYDAKYRPERNYRMMMDAYRRVLA